MKPIFDLVVDALRLAFFRKVPAENMDRGWGCALGVVFATVVLPNVFSLGRHGLTRQWDWYLLPTAVFHVALILIAAIIVAYFIGRTQEVARFLFAGLLATFAIELVALTFASLAADVPTYERLADRYRWFPGAWLALAMATFVGRHVPAAGRRIVVAGVCIVVIAVPLAIADRDRSLWNVPDETFEQGSRSPRLGEDAFYKQPELLARELQAVQPGRKGVVDVFFVGFAGYGGQDVFMKEVKAVARLFRERFDAEGRVVSLINNPGTLLETPIASRTSLRAALDRVAEVMDVEEDVLVLFLTSHGSQDHKFSLRLGGMGFHELQPAVLRSLLDGAGIRNRVVIISACYSGGFVKALEGPDTLIITAAAANRMSFGCTNEAEWTYFGRAFFDEALRKTHSFSRAFEIARPVVTAREKSENFEPSEPQISMGAAIAGKLDLLAAQLDAGTLAPTNR